MTLLGDGRRGAPAGPDVAFQGDTRFWAALVQRVRQGERDAETEVAHRFHERVRVMASARLHGSDAAADVAQDTILAVLEALRAGSLRDPDKLPAFVLSIARNIINSYLRTEAHRREAVVDSPDPAGGPTSGGIEFADDRRALVREALKVLNDLDRRILLLTLVDGMTPREIAPVAALTPEVVRTRKARAVKAISLQIEKLTRRRFWNHIGTSGPKP